MIYRQYKYKFYLNLNHSIRIRERMGEIHPHTWEITTDIMSRADEFTQFSNIEKKINLLFEKYQDRYINEIHPFNRINPTIENVCEYFFGLIQGELLDSGWILLMIEMSETPSRSYMINAVNNYFDAVRNHDEKEGVKFEDDFDLDVGEELMFFDIE